MTGPAAAEQEPTNIPAPIDELIMRVGNLEPAQVKPELGSIINGSGRLLAKVVRIHEPSVGVDVIEAIHGALSATKDPHVRRSLTFGTIYEVGNAIGVRENTKGSAELAERTALLTDVIGYPPYRSEALLRLAGAMVNVSTTKARVLAPQAKDYIEQAADVLAGHMGDTGRGVYHNSDELASLYKAGEFAAENAAVIIKTGAAAPIDAPIRIHRQAAQIIDSKSGTKYGAGLEKPNLVKSIIRSAAEVAHTAGSGTDLEQALVDMSEAMVNEVLESYKSELKTPYAYITLDMKCEELTNLGSGMIDTMVRAYDKGQDTAQMQRLIKQAVTVFEAASGYAERFGKSRRSNRTFSGGRSIFASSEKIAKAAQSVVGMDFESSMRMYEIAFGTGQIEDKVADNHKHSYKNAVIHKMHEDANGINLSQQATIELFGLAHELLDSSYSTNDNKLQQMTENAERMIRYVSSSRCRGKLVMIDDTSEKLAAFVTNPENIDSFIEHTWLFNTTSDSLTRLSSHIKNPRLKRSIKAKTEALRAEEDEKLKETRKPKNETDRLARQVLESL